MSKPRTSNTYALDTVGSPFLTANIFFLTALSTHDELFDKQDSSTPESWRTINFISPTTAMIFVSFLKMSRLGIFLNRVALYPS